MGISVRVVVTGDQTVRRVLTRVDPDRRPDLLRELLAELAGKTIEEVRRAMPPGSGPARPDRLTQRSGRLVKSLTIRRGPNFAEVGTAEEYGAVHEFARGGRRAWLKPAATKVAATGAALLEARLEREIARA